MKIIKISTELEMSVHEFPAGTIREQNKGLCELIGNGCDTVERRKQTGLSTEENLRDKTAGRIHEEFGLSRY